MEIWGEFVLLTMLWLQGTKKQYLKQNTFLLRPIILLLLIIIIVNLIKKQTEKRERDEKKSAD